MSATPGGPAWAFVGRLAAALAIVGLGVFGATQFLARPWTISGPSMEPVLRDGDRVIADLWTLRGRPPLPGEIVLFEGSAPGVLLVKRVAGGPRPGPEPGTSVYELLGDNPAESLDSRAFGPIGRERILGRVVIRYWPLSRAGKIE